MSLANGKAQKSLPENLVTFHLHMLKLWIHPK